MIQAFRAGLLHFLGNPAESPQNCVYHPDGLLVIEDGEVVTAGRAEDILDSLPKIAVSEYPDGLLVPGFIDLHTHYPQTEIIAAPGGQLLPWLNRYAFPAESRFGVAGHARQVAERFLDELLRAGTTTALVFGSVHKTSVDSFFAAASARGLRMIAGKSMMDCNAPAQLLDTAASSYADSKALIETWHNRGRLRYAVTPRFAATSSAQQLRLAGQLLRDYPGVYLQTHLAENAAEIDWIKQLYPAYRDYLDVYDQAGLLGRRSIFAHCLHLRGREWTRLAETQSNIAFCPTSNLFLGSGLFSLRQAVQRNIRVGFGTDIGAGTSFSLLQTLNEAYKVLQLQQQTLDPLQGLYMTTLGAAEALDLANVIGNFAPGKEADFVILDKGCTPLIKYRTRLCQTIAEIVFVLSMLGDDRAVRETWAAGKRVHQRDRDQSL